MENYFIFVEKHNEVTAQALLEDWERFAGVHQVMPADLETRWSAFISATEINPAAMAA